MALPRQIERDAAAAEDLQKAMYTEGQASDAEASQPAPVVNMPAAGEPPANVVELPQVAEPAKPEDDVAYWRQRFNTVQGKLDAEMPRMFHQMRDQSEQIKKLTEQLEVRNTPQTPDPDSLVNQKDVDAFGEDLMDAMRRTAQDEHRKAYVAERANLEERFGRVETQVGQVAVDSFWGEVSKLVPDWAQVDQNPAWIAWLDSSPEYSEDTYRTLASKAISKGNSQKVAKLVDTWRGAQPSQPTKPQRAQQSELERQVAPSTVRGNPAPVAGKVYSRQEYEALYDVRNPQRYGDKQANAMIAEADVAVAEGRVRWT